MYLLIFQLNCILNESVFFLSVKLPAWLLKSVLNEPGDPNLTFWDACGCI